MARKSVVIRLAGESGEGVISSGDILTQAAARWMKNVCGVDGRSRVSMGASAASAGRGAAQL